MGKVNAYVLKDGSVINGDIMERYALKTSSVPGSDQIQHNDILGSAGLIPHPVNFKALIELLQLNTYHYRAVKTKARDAVGIGWSLQPKDNINNPNEQQKAEAENFLKNPHPEKTLEEILTEWAEDMQTTGNGYLELIKGDERTGRTANGSSTRQLLAVDHIPSHTMYRNEDMKRYVQELGGKKSWLIAAGAAFDVINATGVLVPLNSLNVEERGNEVIHILNYTPSTDYYGLPDILPALRSIYGDMKRAEYNTAFFENFAVPAYAVTITGADLTPELEAKIKSYFQTDLKNNPHSTLVLSAVSDPEDPTGQPIEIKYEKLAVDENEASFVVYRKDNKDEVLAAHGVPPYRLGIAEVGSLGGSTAVESTEVYKQSILKPIQAMIEARINKHILEGCFGVVDWVFRFDEIDTRDDEKDTAIELQLFAVGALTPNEIRQARGWKRIEHPAMDMTYISNQPIDRLMQQEQPDLIPQEDNSTQEQSDPNQRQEKQTAEQLLSQTKALHNRLVDIALKGEKK